MTLQEKILKNMKTLEKYLKPVVPQRGVIWIFFCLDMYLSLYMYIFVWYVKRDQKIFPILLFWSECPTLVSLCPFIPHSFWPYCHLYIFISLFYNIVETFVLNIFSYILIVYSVVKTKMKNNSKQRASEPGLVVVGSNLNQAYIL